MLSLEQMKISKEIKKEANFKNTMLSLEPAIE